MLVRGRFLCHLLSCVQEYLSASALVTSAILFSLGDVDVAPSMDSNVLGLVIVCVSLVADAMHSNTQVNDLHHHTNAMRVVHVCCMFLYYSCAMITLLYAVYRIRC